MKKNLLSTIALIVTIAAISAPASAHGLNGKEPILVRTSECESFQIQVITTRKTGTPDSDIYGYCDAEEAQAKLDAINATPRVDVAGAPIYRKAIPLFQQ